jgi:hypothetical protein
MASPLVFAVLFLVSPGRGEHRVPVVRREQAEVEWGWQGYEC